MKYWGYLVAKVFAAAGVLSALWAVARPMLLPSTEPSVYSGLEPMGHDLLYSSGVYVLWLFSVGLLYLIILDQRYRCRTCVRKLCMPVRRGSWTHMLLLGRPHIEYICPYGHGTLKVPELQLTGKEPIDWAEHQDIWKELEVLHTDQR